MLKSINLALCCSLTMAIITISQSATGRESSPYGNSNQGLEQLEVAPKIPMCKPEPIAHKLPLYKNVCRPKDYLSYPNCYPEYPTLPDDKPRRGFNADSTSEQCSFMSRLISGDFLDEMTKKLEQHEPDCPEGVCQTKCDKDCDNLFISELYESYLIKFSLEYPKLAQEIIRIYQKIFDKFEKSKLQAAFDHWVQESPLFPVSQKDRDWSKYEKNVALKDIIGLSHDPTNILLSGDFLKHLQYELPDEFKAKRDYMFNNVLKKARGYRTNSKKGREGLVEDQIGITSFDFRDLKLQPGYYDPKKWMHPGRSLCDTMPTQGMYQNEALQRFIPLKCGISGSTNFWIWTALYSGVNMTQDEVRLFIFSAFLVLGADGGHSLMEVLSSATMSAIYMHNYEAYSNDLYLIPFIRKSNFAKNLYEVTKDINPIGNGEIMCIDYDRIADHIYAQDRYQPYNDKRDLDETETNHRKEIEAFFLLENSRFVRPFGDYATFLDKIPELGKVRRNVGKKLKQFVKNYCVAPN